MASSQRRIALANLQMQARFDLHASAASGLVVQGDLAWVVADDRCVIEAYELSTGQHRHAIRLTPDATDAPLRKRDKPDFEALADLGDGTLIVLGSGSRPNRERGFAITSGAVALIDLSALYDRLSSDIEALNIEGAVRCGEHLLLAHRGAGKRGSSRIVRLDLTVCSLVAGAAWPAAALIEIISVPLGTLDDVPLSFTDLALDGRGDLHYLAAAEQTDDPYLDGRCTGSIIGTLDEHLSATPLARLRPDVKAEGLAWWNRSDGANRWLVVTDADDADRRSTLFELEP